MRATTSVGPPAANGTTILTGRVGKSTGTCAEVADAIATAAKIDNSTARMRILPALPIA